MKIKLDVDGKETEFDFNPSDHKLFEQSDIDKIVQERVARSDAKITLEFEAKSKELTKERDTLKADLDSKNSGESESEKRLGKIEKDLKEERELRVASQAALKTEQQSKVILESINGRSLVNGAGDLYQSAARSKMNEEGKFELPDGSFADAAAFAESWFAGDTGSRLVISNDVGGPDNSNRGESSNGRKQPDNPLQSKTALTMEEVNARLDK